VTPPEPFTNIESMAAHYINEMRTIQPVGPYHLGGYCFGGVIAFEMARQLALQNEKVGILALIDSMPPNVATNSKFSLEFFHFLKTLPAWLAYSTKLGPREMFVHFTQKLASIAKKLAKRHDASNVEDKISEVFDFQHYPPDFKRFAEIHFIALTQYRPQIFPGRVTLLRTNRPRLFDFNSEKLWGKIASGGVTVKIIPGTHEKVLEDPYVGVVAEKLRENLEQGNLNDANNSVKRAMAALI
jgi:thioesterase domain-containing protein